MAAFGHHEMRKSKGAAVGGIFWRSRGEPANRLLVGVTTHALPSRPTRCTPPRGPPGLQLAAACRARRHVPVYHISLFLLPRMAHYDSADWPVSWVNHGAGSPANYG